MTDTKKDGAKRPCIYMLRCKDGSLYTGWTNAPIALGLLLESRNGSLLDL